MNTAGMAVLSLHTKKNTKVAAVAPLEETKDSNQATRPSVPSSWSALVQSNLPSSEPAVEHSLPCVGDEDGHPSLIDQAAATVDLPPHTPPPPPVRAPSEEHGTQRLALIGGSMKKRRCSECTMPLKEEDKGRQCARCCIKACPSAATGSSEGRYLPPHHHIMRKRAGESEQTVRLSNIGEASECDVREAMRPFGTVTRVHVALDKETKEPRGFAFVTFHREDDAAAVIRSRLTFNHLLWHAEVAEDRPWAPY